VFKLFAERRSSLAPRPSFRATRYVPNIQKEHGFFAIQLLLRSPNASFQGSFHPSLRLVQPRSGCIGPHPKLRDPGFQAHLPCSIAELADGVVSLAPTTTSSPEMAASSFSYAQAARGQGGPTAAAPASTTNSQHDQAGVEPAPSKLVSLPPASVDVADQEQTSSAPSIATIDRHDIDSTSGLDSDARSESVHERRFDLRRDDDVGRLDRPWRRNDKGTRSSSATTRSVDEQDSRKPRKANKKKPSDKQSAESTSVTDQDPEAKPEPPKVELSEAPIPSVNIWQQRKEAQQAKVAPAVETATESANGLPSSSPHVKSTAGAPPQNGVPDSITSNGIKPQAKANENVRPERNGSRGARALARDGKTEVPPPVGDSASWPTPETAISTTSEDRKKTADKGDRLEKDGQDDKPRQKKNWMAYEYVPTVTFETQLPPARGSKPRGGAKGANGNRTTAPSTGDKPAGPAAPAKAAETRERIREAPNGTNRNTSDPPVSKRPPFETTNPRAEPKKPASNVGADKTKDVAAPSNTVRTRLPKCCTIFLALLTRS
jgi:la-related protein 1